MYGREVIPCRFCGAVIARRSAKGVPWLSVAAVSPIQSNSLSKGDAVRKSHLGAVLARRLKIPPGRIEAIAQRLQDAGLISRTEGSRRYPPDLSEREVEAFVLAVLTDNGLHNVREAVGTFAALPSPSGQRFGDALAAILRGELDVSSGSIAIRLDPPSVALTAGGVHERFGPEPSDAATKTVALPGRVLAAVALELQGRSPAEADAILALSAVRRNLTLMTEGASA